MKLAIALALSLLVVSGVAARADEQSPPHRCAVVCPSGTALDTEHCACKPPKPIPGAHCALACPAPGQTLDARHCKCVATPE